MMIKRLFLWLIGAARVRVLPGDVERVTEAIFSAGLPVTLLKRRGGGRTLILRAKDLPFFEEICRGIGVNFRLEKRYGLPVLLYRYRLRVGLFIGFAIMIAALFVSDDFVWRIDISGNENVPSEKIEAELEALGFGLGTYYKNIDFDVLHNRFLLNSPDIAWIAINMKGSVARVEVLEYMKGGEPPPKSKANVVAACDGVITQVSDFAGSPQVKIGDEVKKGQLLISGLVEYEGVGTDIVYARGEVYAEVTRDIFVSVPLTFEENVKTGENTSDFGIKIFGDTIFFGRGGRIDTSFYDTITITKDVVLLNTVTLPIKVVETRYEPYETVTKTVTETEASAIAYREFKEAFIDACRGVTLLSYETESGMNAEGDAYEIRCVLRVIDNIAETVEFEAAE